MYYSTNQKMFNMKKVYAFLFAFALCASLTAQWATQNTFAGHDYNVLWVDAVDENNVWGSLEQNVGGYYFNPVNKVVRSADGGKTWQTYEVGNDPLDFITCIYARSAQELWVLTFNYGTFSGKMFHTTDGGATFVHESPEAFGSPGSYPDAIYFYDAQNGVAFGDPVNGEYEVYTTSDGGNTWVQTPGENIPDPQPGEFGFQMAYADNGANTFFGTNGGRMLRTADHGYTLESVELPYQDANTANVGGIAFSDAMNGMLVYNFNPDAQAGTQPKPLRTTDGGLTWSVIDNSNGDSFDEYGLLRYVPGTTGTFLAGIFDGYAYTKDYGVTWKYFENNKIRLPGVDCLNPFVCYGGIWSDNKNTGSKVARWMGYQLANPNAPGTSITMKASPNPATGPVTVTFSQPLAYDGQLFILDNTSNNILIQADLSAGQSSASINVGSLSPGIYWLRAVVGSQVLLLKFFRNNG